MVRDEKTWVAGRDADIHVALVAAHVTVVHAAVTRVVHHVVVMRGVVHGGEGGCCYWAGGG